MKTALVAIFCIAALSGCATPWPTDMPPTTYAGTVYNEPLGRNEPNAKISATRLSMTSGLIPGQPFIPIDPMVQTMATTRSGKNGDFVLTTPSGYATGLWAESNDGSMDGWLEGDLKKGGKNLVIKIRPRASNLNN